MLSHEQFDVNYEHTQTSPLDDLLFLIAGAEAIAAWCFRDEPLAVWALLAMAALTGFLSLCF